MGPAVENAKKEIGEGGGGCVCVGGGGNSQQGLHGKESRNHSHLQGLVKS